LHYFAAPLGAAFMFLSLHLNKFLFVLALWCVKGYSQNIHPNAHAHNDYEHEHPLLDAMKSGFMSVEADVHWRRGQLVVAHNLANRKSPRLEEIYIKPLDSLMGILDGCVYPCNVQQNHPFYLMIDVKTDAEVTYLKIRNLVDKYPRLKNRNVMRIFLSGNRAIQTMVKDDSNFIGIDGRPEDLGKGYTREVMPVISDHFRNWCTWNGKSKPGEEDLAAIRKLAIQVHRENKLLRLWSIPDNELVWQALLDAGVDLINTDHLEELHRFLMGKGL
jgi:hypothetical protein